MTERRRTVLVVEDHEPTRAAVRRALGDLGVEVREAETLHQSFQSLLEVVPDLIILDLGLPGGSGLKVCAEVRDRFGDFFLPIVVLTAQTDLKTKLTCVEMGAHDFIAKPFGGEELRAHVKVMLKLKAMHDDLQEAKNLLELKSAELENALESERKFLTEVRVENERLAGLLVVDNLTGLYNHGHFMERLKAQVSLSRRHKTPFTVVLLDLDRFRELNENHGHNWGNLFLRRTAELLLSAVRTTDIVARFGGDEFAILLHHTPQGPAAELTDRLRTLVGGTEFEHEGKKGKATVSGGVLEFSERHTAAETFGRELEGLVARAKQQGRNRIATPPG